MSKVYGRMGMLKLHLILTIAWAVMIIPTLLWLRESILWVALMSIYSIVVGHWGAYQAAHAEKCLKNKVDESKEQSSEDQSLRERLIFVEAEFTRFKEGKLTLEEFHNLCHNLDPTVHSRQEFEQGCKQYQDKLFGRKDHG